MLEIGNTAAFAKTITEYDIYSFAGITGDFNPVHVDEEAVKRSAFKPRIAHEMLTGSFVSTVIGNKMPEPGTVYLERDLKYSTYVYWKYLSDDGNG